MGLYVHRNAQLKVNYNFCLLLLFKKNQTTGLTLNRLYFNTGNNA